LKTSAKAQYFHRKVRNYCLHFLF